MIFITLVKQYEDKKRNSLYPPYIKKPHSNNILAFKGEDRLYWGLYEKDGVRQLVTPPRTPTSMNEYDPLRTCLTPRSRLMNWFRRRHKTRSASASGETSPDICGRPNNVSKSTANQAPRNTNNSGVRLIDTRIVKGANGFGMTLAEVVTFIPSRMVGIRVSPVLHPDKVGFYQRLLQVRCVNDVNSPKPHDKSPYNKQSTQTSSTSVYPGDILLAIGGYRLAGCSPEYAIRLLSNVPTGGAVQVTLLRGLALAPIVLQENRRACDLVPANFENVNPATFSPPSRFSDLPEIARTAEGVPHLIRQQMQRCGSAEQIYSSQTSGEDSEATLTIDLYKREDGFGFTLIRSPEGFVVEKVSASLTCITQAGHKFRLIEPGDTLVEVGNLKAASFTQQQLINLLDAYPMGKSVRFVIKRARHKCAELANALQTAVKTDVSGGNSDPSVLMSAPPTQQLVKLATNSPAIITLPPYTIMPILQGSKGNNQRLENVTSSVTAVTGFMPFRCVPQGVGTSGPCKTPDYVPASHFFHNASPKNTPPVKITNESSACGNGQRLTNDNSQTSSPIISPFSSPQGGVAQPSPGLLLVDIDVSLQSVRGSYGFQMSSSPARDGMFGIVSIDQNGPAAQSKALFVGDLLLAVNGNSMVGVSRQTVMQVICPSADDPESTSIRLTVRGLRKPGTSAFITKSSPSIRFRTFEPVVHNEENQSARAPIQETKDSGAALIDVSLQRQPNEGFGFVIVSSLKCDKASEIGRVIPGSPADRSGKLEIGDRILAINGQPLAGLHHAEIVQLIRLSQQNLNMTVQKQKNPSSVSEASSSPLAGYRKPNSPNHTGRVTESSDSTCCTRTLQSKSSFLPNCNKTDVDVQNVNEQSQRNSIYTVELNRSHQGYGFSIRGGSDYGRIPLFIFRVAEGSPAQKEGQIQVGDEILEINGQPACNMTHQQAVNAIKQTESQLKLVLSHSSTKLHDAYV
ncbi:unnamed protein product [Calicophoron daubneyi]|uniref:PDZ domain-containing protein n=1 Tax=Calicophoron daubneyi TaxID=300641 RepID=A0AAV2TZS9_CALDB